MRGQKQNIDDVTRSILRKDMTQAPSPAFTERVMEKVLESKKISHKLSGYLKRSWVFLGISVALLPLFYRSVTTVYSEYFAILHEWMASGQQTVQYVIAVLLCLAILYLFDIIAGQTFREKRHMQGANGEQLV
jgi:hypothetical protein